MNRILTVLLLILAMNCATVQAQHGRYGRWYRGSDYAYGLRVPINVTPWGVWPYPGGYGYVWPYYGYGYRRYGLADIIRARSQAAKNYAEAQIRYQQARSKYIDNQKKWLETYYERKRLAEAARRARIEERKARAKRSRLLSKPEPHPRLSADELDPNTGKLTWPVLLRKSEFAASRKRLEELFELRLQTGMTPDLTKKIYARAQEMRVKLIDKVRTVSGREYIDARRFLERMAHEAYHAPD